MKVMLTVGRYFKQKFGYKVRKIPISLSGFTCPNIDGTVAKGGCIYCKNETFSPSLVLKKQASQAAKNLAPTDPGDALDSTNPPSPVDSNPANPTAPTSAKWQAAPSPKVTMNFKLEHNPLLPKQLEELEAQFYHHSSFHREKFGISKYLVYFQSFTNTYAPFDTLKALYTRALELPDVVGLSIGTRVDCVDSKLLDFLGDFVKAGKEIWLEYGIQSIYEETLALTNRGHSMAGVRELFEETRRRGIKVCAHLIYGLPNESVPMMLTSLQTMLDYGIDSLKIHPLYVVEGTALARLHKKGAYEPISLEDYGEAIAQSLRLIPPTVIVQRVSAGAHDESLIAPKWCFDKNVQMKYLRERLKREGIAY